VLPELLVPLVLLVLLVPLVLPLVLVLRAPPQVPLPARPASLALPRSLACRLVRLPPWALVWLQLRSLRATATRPPTTDRDTRHLAQKCKTLDMVRRASIEFDLQATKKTVAHQPI
jgi:hypothetical protein